MKVLIATFFGMKSVPIVAHKLGADKVILVIGEAKGKDKELLDKNVEEFKKNFHYLTVEVAETDSIAVPLITKTFLKLIDKEKDNEIIINMSEARKPMFLAGLFAVSLRKKLVKSVNYYLPEKNDFLELPLLMLDIDKTKLAILRQINLGNKDPNSIARKVGNHRSNIYLHLKELKENKFITEDRKLTISGEIVLL